MAWKPNWGGQRSNGGNNWQDRAKPAMTQVKQESTQAKPSTTQPQKTAGTFKPTASAPGGGSKVALKVTTQSKKNEVITTTLIGDYAEMGQNHGRQYYKKMQKIAGHENVNVYLYYWDQRDGAEFSGWWFGDQLGGTQVWAKASVHTPTPPKVGWRVPWDSPKVEPGVLVVEPAKVDQAATAPATAAAAAAKTTPATSSAVAPAQRVKKTTELVTSAESASNAAVANAKKTNENEKATDGQVKSALENLTKQQEKLNEAQKTINADISEIRKTGPSGLSQISELQKLTLKIKAALTALSPELTKLKSKQAKADNEKKKQEEDKKLKAKEVSDKKEFNILLPKAKTATKTVEDSVNRIETNSNNLLESTPEGDALTKALTGVEQEAAEALKKVQEARNDLNVKLASARQYAPETKKEAMNELNQLQQKLAEAQKKLVSYKEFKKTFSSRVEARKALAEVTKKLDAAEIEIEKASNIVKASDVGQMSEDEIAEADKVVAPATKSINEAMTIINQKSRQADASMQAELSKLRSRGTDVRGKLDKVSAKLKGQKEGVSVQGWLADASEKLEKMDQAYMKCQEAEMPFLKGIEVLPKQESDEALAASDKASREASTAVAAAKNFIKSKLAATKGFSSKELQQTVTDQLTPLSKRADAAEDKVNNFKKETAERKMNAVLAEAVEAVVDTERKANAVVTAGKDLAGDKLPVGEIDSLKSAIEKCEAACKEFNTSLNQSRKVVAAKQREAKTGPGREALDKINARIKTAQDKVEKQKQASMTATKLIKAKEVLDRESARLKEAEADVEKAEAPTLMGAGLSEEMVRKMEDDMANAGKILKALPSLVKPQLNAAPESTKAELQKLLDRSVQLQEKLDKLKKDTKKEREEVLIQVFVKDGEAKAKACEDVIEKCGDVELPYLKGLEVLVLQEALDTIEASEKVVAEATETIAQARNYIATKNIEARALTDAKKVSEAFSGFTERINAVASKLGTFKKDTDTRKKAAQVQQAGEMVTEVEDLVKKTVEASEPFTKEDADKLSEAEAKAPLEKFMASASAAQTRLNEVRTLTKKCQAASRDNTAQVETLTKLTTRITEASADLTKAKKTTGVHEHRFLATRLLEEVNPKFVKLDEEIKKATAACAPLLEEGGEEYLVLTSIRTLATALTKHAKAKDLDMQALFKEAGGPKNVKETGFVKYLEGLPEKTGHEELSFPEDRRLAIFKALDKDKDGAISPKEFEAIFVQKGTCKKAISVTESFKVEDGKTISKAEAGEELELFDIGKEDTDMVRSQCKLADGKMGWITVKGNQGSEYVNIRSAYDSFCADMDKAVKEGVAAINNFQSYLAQKTRDITHSSGPLADAKAELLKLRPQVAEKLKALEDLKKKVNMGKSQFKQKEQAEKNAHIEAREQKEAAVIVSVAEPKVEAFGAAAKAVMDAGDAFPTDKEEIAKFATPSTVATNVEKHAAAAQEALVEAQKSIKEQLELAAKTTPQTKATKLARNNLNQLSSKVDETRRKMKKVVDGVKRKCSDVVDLFKEKVAVALRAEVLKSGAGYDKAFEDLSKKKGAISDEAFSKKVQGLEGISIQKEQAKLLFSNIGNGSDISKHVFLSYVQLYYITVKDIAFSDVFQVKDCKTLRKAEKDEVVEVIEGPTADDTTGIVRVRAKSMVDGQEGWITVKGNQGTPFLEEIKKIFYSCKKADVQLQKEFKSDSETIRTLGEEEVLELIEGPRKEVLPDAQRVRLKATKDNANGWITLKDRNAVVYAASNPNLYTCTSTVALTDGEDIKTCKVVRKLAEGEWFEASGPAVEDAASSVWRLPGKALKDGKEGWLTTKGNAGTVYAEAMTKYYSVKKEVQLEKRFQSAGAEAIRKMEVGETFQLLEGPRDEKAAPEVRVKVRCVRDGKVGWISKKATIKTWNPVYRCLDKAPMSDSRAATAPEESKVLRELLKGEGVEMLDGPFDEGKDLRIRCRATKDGIIGWVSIKSDGKRLFDN